MNFLKTIFKTILSCVLLSFTALFGFNYFSRNLDLEAANKKIDSLLKDNDKLLVANRLLKVDRQLAIIRLKHVEYKDNTTINIVEFFEIDKNGKPLSIPKEYKTIGDLVYIDGLVAKFEDGFIEEGDPLKGVALFAFKSIYGEEENPENGRSLKTGDIPKIYGKADSFEESLWKNFWDYAHDKDKMKKSGLRCIHGQAVFIQPRLGYEYEICLRSTGELSIKIL